MKRIQGPAGLDDRAGAHKEGERMGKNKILPVLLALLFPLLPACATAECPTLSSVPPPASRTDSGGGNSSAVSGAFPAGSAGPVSSGPPESSAASGSGRPSGEVSAPGRDAGSAVVLRSSPPPTAAPGRPARPMPPVAAKMPAASGSAVFSREGAAVDYSNASQGYVMVKYSGAKKIKVLVYFNGGSSYYQYNITGGGAYTVLPLQSGSGSYRIRFMENVSGSSYAELCSTQIGAAVSGSGCYLYPNQYVSYSRSSAAVAKAGSLCSKAASNAEKVDAIYHYITANIKYDYAKVNRVKPGYLPNVDGTLASKKGICFDYSSLMAAMCRSQGVPAKLVIGTASVGYHAWNEVYLGKWIRYDATFGAAGQTAAGYTAEKYY